MDIWILFTVMAAIMQALRTAGQKQLAAVLSPACTSLVRYLFGLPFVIIYLHLVLPDGGYEPIAAAMKIDFLFYASIAAISQIIATVLLVKLLTLRNFAVATVFAKTEAIQAAGLGFLFFGASFSGLAWLAIALGTIGILSLSWPQNGRRFDSRNTLLGLLSGLAFAVTSVFLREASLSLDNSYISNAAITLAYTVVLQTALCLAYVLYKEARQLPLLAKKLPLAFFVGATSAVGSIGWYTAMTYQDAALVKSLGQIELIFTVLIGYFFFREKVVLKEALGIITISSSVLILLLAI